MAKKTAVTPTREENFPLWYQEVVKLAELAEHAPVRGCMVIRPWGYAIWEYLQKDLDRRLKAFGVENAYFPLFIPLSYFEKEAKHVEGFATECAVVTHHRLEKKGDKLIPSSALEEPLIVRPTSEMIIGEMFAKWVQSYRDLPLRMNQWANVVRWEMRPRIFLRTAEFLWQEGHTVHEDEKSAKQEALKMLNCYVDWVEDMLALPSIKGEKSENERFPGAVHTYTYEMMMQDGKALQAGTSHFLGQNFARASGIKYLSKEGKEELAWTTSWGSTTRLIGAMIMTHGDDDGLILPPKVAPYQIVIIPIVHQKESEETVFAYCDQLKKALSQLEYGNRSLDVHVDQRDLRGGEKIWHWIKKGVPIRIEVGLREIEEKKLSVALRTSAHKDKQFLTQEELLQCAVAQLEGMHNTLLQRAQGRLNSHIVTFDDQKAFRRFFSEKEGSISGGFARCFFAGDPSLEAQIKDELNVTIRCIPFEQPQSKGRCLFTGKETSTEVLFAKSY